MVKVSQDQAMVAVRSAMLSIAKKNPEHIVDELLSYINRFVCGGIVEDAGGGVVRIVVDRETMNYPAIGAHILLVRPAVSHTDATPEGQSE